MYSGTETETERQRETETVTDRQTDCFVSSQLFSVARLAR